MGALRCSDCGTIEEMNFENTGDALCRDCREGAEKDELAGEKVAPEPNEVSEDSLESDPQDDESEGE